MIVRLMFKAGLSLGLLLGVASYGQYLAGGDPGATWRHVAGGAIDGVAGSFAELGGKVRASAVLPSVAGTGGESGADGGSRRDDVWTWRDADGVTHYASASPGRSDATLVSVDPDTNVLAPPVLPVAADERARGGVPANGVRHGAPAGGDVFGTAPGTTAWGAVSSGAARSNAARTGSRAAPDDAEALPGIAGAILRARGDAPAPDPARAEALLKLLQPVSR